MSGGREERGRGDRAAAWEHGMFELSHDVMLVLDLTGTIQHVNKATLELTGYSLDDVCGKSYVAFVDPGDLESAAREFVAVAESGKSVTGLPLRVKRKDGESHWLEIRAALDAEQELVYIVGRDVTGRDRSVAQAMAAAVVNSPVGWALIGPDGRLRQVNAAFCHMLGWESSELLGQELWTLEAESDPDVVAAERRSLAAGLAPLFRMDRAYRRADEGRAEVSVVGTLVSDPAGAPHYYVCQVEDVTRRREEQDRLAASEAQLAEAQQIARLGSWEWIVVDDRVVWSDELYRIHGLSKDHHAGVYGSALELVHDDDRVRVQRVIEAAIADGRGWSLDYRIVRADGDERALHTRGEVVYDDGRRLVAVRGTCQDVTESRRVEDALRAAEQLFRRAFDDAPVGMALLDSERCWLRTNRALSQMLGRSDAELRAGLLDDFAIDADRDIDREQFADLVAGRRRAYAVEKRFARAEGGEVTALVHISLLRSHEDQPLYFICQLVDLTERRRAEAERERSEQLLRAIVDNSPALVTVKDVDLRYAMVNRRWEMLHGITAEQAVGRSDLDLFESGGERVLDLEVLRTGRPFELLTPVETDGGRRELLTIKFPLVDAEGRTTAVCAIATDVTERRRSALERDDLMRRLARAERLEAVGQLAGGVAHDFNNLLSVILTCAGFAQREAEPDTALRDDIDEIKRAAERAGELVRRLLAFGRKEVVQPRLIDVVASVADMEVMLRRSLPETVRLGLHLGTAARVVLLDPVRLEQVLLNLVLNARDALGDRTGEITISVQTGSDGRVRIEVADDGPGMSPAVAQRAFEPFFTTKGAGEGTGLGLATVEGIVAEVGGTVELSSVPGQGTTVTVELPPATGEADVARPAPPRREAPDGATAGRILVVEDQEAVRRQVCRILEAHGFDVAEAADGASALELVDDVDVLLTDVVMPVMGGQDLARLASDRRPGLRVVFMSGHTEDIGIHVGVRDGHLGFVRKPFSEEALVDAVTLALAPEPIV